MPTQKEIAITQRALNAALALWVKHYYVEEVECIPGVGESKEIFVLSQAKTPILRVTFTVRGRTRHDQDTWVEIENVAAYSFFELVRSLQANGYDFVPGRSENQKTLAFEELPEIVLALHAIQGLNLVQATSPTEEAGEKPVGHPGA